MWKIITAVFMTFLLIDGGLATPVGTESTTPNFISREEWDALKPIDTESMANPVNNVVIHHTSSPPACSTLAICAKAVRSIQNYHVNNRQWGDIGYSFLVGGDNNVYVGRGWSTVGAHVKKYNRDSIGISIIGNWTGALPPAAQLQVVKDLIKYGVEHGKIKEDYRLMGHRQGTATECPGQMLYDEIKTWPHWS